MASFMTVYRGVSSEGQIDVTADGRPLPMKSLSSDTRGSVPFSWGDDFQGADRLALSLLADCVDPDSAIGHLQDFVKQVIGKLGVKWEMTSEDIREFCEYKDRIGLAVQTARWSTAETGVVRKIPLSEVLPPRIIADPNYRIRKARRQPARRHRSKA